jgi:hypothetical protein
MQGAIQKPCPSLDISYLYLRRPWAIGKERWDLAWGWMAQSRKRPFWELHLLFAYS